MSRAGTSRIPSWAWVGLGFALLFNVWWRGHTFGPSLRDHLGVTLWPVVEGQTEPLDCDEAAYGYMGRRVLAGDVLYRDLTENKPPLGYWIYTLAVAIGGANELTIRLLPIPMVLTTIGLVWWIALRIQGPAAACLAAMIYALMSTDPYLFGNSANLEHAINLFATASLACMVRALQREDRLAVFAAGALLGAACLVKQVAVTHLPLYLLALLIRRPDSGSARPLRSRLGDLGRLLLGLTAIVGIAAMVLLLRGAGEAAFDDIVRYGGALATDVPADPHAPPFWLRLLTGNADPNGHLPWPFGRTDYLVWWGTGSWPLWIASLPALGWLLLGRSDAPRRLLVAWTLSAWVQVALPGLFWQHYYLLPVPGASLAVAITLAEGLRGLISHGSRQTLAASGIAVLLGLAAVGGTAAIQGRDYLLVPPEQLTVRYKGGGQWVFLRALGRDLAWRARVWNNPSLFIWGWQSPLLFYSGLDSVSAEFFTNELLRAHANDNHPIVRPRIDQIMKDLQANPPEILFAGYPPFPALQDFLYQGYYRSQIAIGGQRLPRTPNGLGLWIESGHFAAFETAVRPTVEGPDRTSAPR